MIGWYVHHHGHGHLNRAVSVARHLRVPVVGLSGLCRPDGWPGEWVRLPPDRTDADPPAVDPTAGGTLHWVPVGHPGLRERMARIGAALSRPEMAVLVVDVSVEVAVAARLSGVRVAVMTQPGDRTDRPHRLAYDLAERLLAPYPVPAVPSGRPPWPARWTARTTHLGGISRFDGFSPPPPPGARRVLALWGGGGTDVGPVELCAAAAATPEWHWRVLGPRPDELAGPANLTWCGWGDDVWPELAAADVVVTHAGLNALAEVAAARRPVVVVAQRRPHDEQRATARALVELGLDTALSSWPDAARWPRLLADAVGAGGRWASAWSTGHGAQDAAAVLEEMHRP